MSQPASPPRSSSLLGVVVAAVAVAVAVVALLAYCSRQGGESAAPPDTGIAKQLKAAGYRMVSSKKHNSAEAGREVVTQTWERSAEPRQVIITDDSPFTTSGVLIVNAVNYRGSDGKGSLSCQPDPEHVRSPLSDILADADKVRAGVQDGSLQPIPDAPGGFPYRGEFMGCMR